MNYSYLLIFLNIVLLSFPLYGVTDKEKYTLDIELPHITYEHSTNSPRSSIAEQEEKIKELFDDKQSLQEVASESIRQVGPSGKDLLIAGFIGYLTFSAAPDIASIWANNTMNNVSSPITMHPYTFENGTLVPPVLEEKPDCSYQPYKPHAYLSYCAQGECLCVDEECYCTVEDCDLTDIYKKSCNAIKLGSIASLSVKLMTILSYTIYQSAQCGYFLCNKITHAQK